MAAECFLLRGGSAIIDGERTILAAHDLDALDRERMTLDVSGHYHQPDVFEFRLRPESR